MRPRRTTPRLLALLLVPLFVIVGAGRAQAFYLCAYDLVARTACCCPRTDQPASEPGARVAAACCCTLEERGAPAPVARSVDRDMSAAADAPPLTVVASAVSQPRSFVLARDVGRWTHAPPRPALRSSQYVALLL
jgi:hypothetical protein